LKSPPKFGKDESDKKESIRGIAGARGIGGLPLILAVV